MSSTPASNNPTSTEHRQILCLVAVFIVGLIARLAAVSGVSLGDDGYWLRVINNFVTSGLDQISLVGQAESRPSWYVPLGISLELFGWNKYSLTLYPVLCGSLIGPLTMVYLSSHGIRRVSTNLIAGLIVALHPSLVVDSGAIVNDVSLTLWLLVTVILLRSIWQQIFTCDRSLYLIGFLAGLSFSILYTTKISGLGLILFWGGAESIYASWGLFKRSFRPHTKAFFSALAGALVMPSLVQALFWAKTGSPFGNYQGEIGVFELSLPAEYYTGKFPIGAILDRYPDMLFRSFLAEGQWALQSAWYPHLFVVGLALVLLALLVGRVRKLFAPSPGATSSPEISIFLFFSVASLLLFSFLQYWPYRISPYYIPNLFTGRVWRWLDFFAPLQGCVVAALLEILQKYRVTVLRIALYASLLGSMYVSGYSAASIYFNFSNRGSDLAELGSFLRDKNRECLGVPLWIDPDGVMMLKFFLGWKTSYEFKEFRPDLLYWGMERGCVVTGGARRDAIPGYAVPSIERTLFAGCAFKKIFSREERITSWRALPLELWSFECEGSDVKPRE